jgi:hypothetical protein
MKSLHEEYVFAHTRSCYRLATTLVVIMPIHAPNQNRAAVDPELTPTDLDPPEADPAGHRFLDVTFGIQERNE